MYFSERLTFTLSETSIQDSRYSIEGMEDYIPQVGDIVKITKSDKDWVCDMDKYDRLIVEIAEFKTSGSCKFKCSSLNEEFLLKLNQWSWRFSDNHFKPLSRLRKYKPDLSKRLPDTYIPKVGDIVKITKGDSLWSREMDIYIGLCVKISELRTFWFSGSEYIKVLFDEKDCFAPHYKDINSWTWSYSFKHFELVEKSKY